MEISQGTVIDEMSFHFRKHVLQNKIEIGYRIPYNFNILLFLGRNFQKLELVSEQNWKTVKDLRIISSMSNSFYIQ